MKSFFETTAIGSMPFTDPDEAAAFSLGITDIPIWPQLPRMGLREQMEIQFSEGMPCAVIDDAGERMYFDTSGDHSEVLGAFYESYVEACEVCEGGGSSDLSDFAISQAYSHGIHALERVLRSRGGGRLPCLKLQTTGPCSFALAVTDQNKRAIYYDEEFRDVIIKALAVKCRWQLRKFAPYAERLICFVDEPILSAFGSSTYVSVKREDVVAAVGEVVEGIHAEGALAGVHCCGNTEWSIPIDSGADILSFDAFDYGESIAMYADAVRAHLEGGGLLSWGIVPTSDYVRLETVDSLEVRLESLMDALASKGIGRHLLAGQAMLTPACGTGSMNPDDSRRVFELLGELSKRMKYRMEGAPL